MPFLQGNWQGAITGSGCTSLSQGRRPAAQLGRTILLGFSGVLLVTPLCRGPVGRWLRALAGLPSPLRITVVALDMNDQREQDWNGDGARRCQDKMKADLPLTGIEPNSLCTCGAATCNSGSMSNLGPTAIRLGISIGSE